MDIKSLYDAAKTSGINFKNEDAVHDCVPVWVEACLNDEEWAVDYFHDLLLDLGSDVVFKIANNISSANQDAQWLCNSAGENNHLGLTLAYSSSSVMRLATIGAEITKCVIKSTTELVEKRKDDWFIDCQGYEFDMETYSQEDSWELRNEK